MLRIAALAGALALSFVACAQSGKVYRIGVLDTTPASNNRANLDALLRGLREAGYVEGKNVVLDYRSSDGRSERFPEMAADLVRAKPDIIVTRGTAAALAAKGAGSIPVVMAASADPVGNRVVASLAHPGGHVTGLTAILSELGPKRLELLKDLVPGLTKIGMPQNMSHASSAGVWRDVERAARPLGLQLLRFDVPNVEAMNDAFAQAVKQGVGAMIVGSEVIAALDRQRAVIDLAARHKLPVIYPGRQAVDAGGLISYGVDYPHLYHRAASYVDRILKGAKPGDLPIEQPTKLELVINLKAAKALGIAVPQRLLLRADQVIE